MLREGGLHFGGHALDTLGREQVLAQWIEHDALDPRAFHSSTVTTGAAVAIGRAAVLVLVCDDVVRATLRAAQEPG